MISVSMEEFVSKQTEYMQKLKHGEKSDNTLRNYSLALKNFIKFIKEQECTDICKDEVIAFKKHMEIEYKPTTANLYIVALNGYLKFLNADDLRVETIEIQKRFSVDTITIDEYKKMLNIAKNKKNNDTYYIMRTLACTGMRISELQYLTVKSLKHGECKIVNKKKVRYILITDDIRQELLAYCQERNITNGYIFFVRNPKVVISEVTALRRLKRIAVLAEVDEERICPHNLRHLFAKRFMEENGDLSELADILGHSRIETTRIYTRSSRGEKRFKMQNLGL